MAASTFLCNAIGIDLGTTYSCVAVFQNDSIVTIENDLGDRTTSSWVSFTTNECIVGNAARDACCKPRSKLYDSKRIIGRNFTDPTVQADIKLWPFAVVNVAGRPKFQIQCDEKKNTQTYTPEQISSRVLRYLKTCAERKLGYAVTRAVVTIPAYFSNSQREATMDAAKLAGLEVLRLLSEPFAAAMAYGLGKRYELQGKILVYDLGGGTFDVSILNVNGGNFEVLATHGDTHLGGEDFTNRMLNHVITEFDAKGTPIPDGKKEKIREQCEKGKRRLIACTYCEIEYADTVITVTRAKFEDLNYDLFSSTLVCVGKALVDAKLRKSDIQEVVMTGGSTRILMIQDMVKEYFDGKELTMTINVDEAVAHGAAIQAAVLSGDPSHKLKDLVLSDVTPLSLGVETNRGNMTIVVKRNSRIPLIISHNFTTGVDNQTAVTLSVYEGERAEVKENTFLDSFLLENIPPLLRGKPILRVVFDVSSDGILTVTATHDDTGITNQVIIKREGRMTVLEIDECLELAKMSKALDDKTRRNQAARNDLESFIYRVKHSVAKKIICSRTRVIEDKCSEILSWLQAQHELHNQTLYEEKQRELDILLLSSSLSNV